MKKLLLFVIFTTLIVQAAVQNRVDTNNAVNIQKYDAIFAEISRKRKGPSNKILSKVATPFVNRTMLKIIKDKNVTKRKAIVLKLYGIIDNKANINKKWYKVKSKVYGYKLVKIKNISVVLKQKKKKLEIFLRKKDDKIQFSKNF